MQLTEKKKEAFTVIEINNLVKNMGIMWLWMICH